MCMLVRAHARLAFSCVRRHRATQVMSAVAREVGLVQLSVELLHLMRSASNFAYCLPNAICCLSAHTAAFAPCTAAVTSSTPPLAASWHLLV